jgi:hypothetical protein
MAPSALAAAAGLAAVRGEAGVHADAITSAAADAKRRTSDVRTTNPGFDHRPNGVSGCTPARARVQAR